MLKGLCDARDETEINCMQGKRETPMFSLRPQILFVFTTFQTQQINSSDSLNHINKIPLIVPQYLVFQLGSGVKVSTFVILEIKL